MKNKIVRYCWECECDTEHELIETVRCFEGASRVILGILSFGISEINNEMEGKYKCTKCGKIRSI